jgi:hypothetical protein
VPCSIEQILSVNGRMRRDMYIKCHMQTGRLKFDEEFGPEICISAPSVLYPKKIAKWWIMSHLSEVKM